RDCLSKSRFCCRTRPFTCQQELAFKSIEVRLENSHAASPSASDHLIGQRDTFVNKSRLEVSSDRVVGIEFGIGFTTSVRKGTHPLLHFFDACFEIFLSNHDAAHPQQSKRNSVENPGRIGSRETLFRQGARLLIVARKRTSKC